MANRILMQTDQVENFRGILLEMSETIKERMNDLKYLIDNFNQVSSSMSILKEHMYQGVKVGNDIRNMLDKMAFDVEKARQAFIAADNQGSALFRGDNNTSSKKIYKGINADNYRNGSSSTWDTAVGSMYTASAVAAIDKLIGLDLEKTWGTGAKISPNKLVTNLRNQGKNHDYRRGLIRNIPKDARDVELDIPKIPSLAKGLGVATVGLTVLSVADDFKNNKTVAQKFESAGVDVTATGAAYFAGGALVGLAEAGCVAIAAPEIAVGIASVGAVVGVGALASIGASRLKSALHLW